MDGLPSDLEVELFDALTAFVYVAKAEPVYSVPPAALEKAMTAQRLFSNAYPRWLAQRHPVRAAKT